ncbi:hypothetical protein SLEP1_g3263 [Rubroshorea leprosula]|uniref:Uncharacterized protein n=1 Tax=Rubroshorea leprosula TaxID=152421 RepID=A0AAV5HK91_9ROSI|nr:hypothetical protein SLEP1_g3263 [Rubroshorea leprosula]
MEEELCKAQNQIELELPSHSQSTLLFYWDPLTSKLSGTTIRAAS